MLKWRQSFRVFYDNNWTYGRGYVGLSAAYRVNDRFTVFGTYEMFCDKENNKQNVITAGLSCRLSVDFASNPSPTRDYENGSTDNVHSSRTDQQSIQLLFFRSFGAQVYQDNVWYQSCGHFKTLLEMLRFHQILFGENCISCHAGRLAKK
jgi:hypothetical protein